MQYSTAQSCDNARQRNGQELDFRADRRCTFFERPTGCLARFVTLPCCPWHTNAMTSPAGPRSESAKPAREVGRALPEIEQELVEAVHEIERGEFSELTTEELDLWADAGVVPWPEEFRD